MTGRAGRGAAPADRARLRPSHRPRARAASLPRGVTFQNALSTALIIIGMIAVGILVWRLVQRQERDDANDNE